jgi:transketolase
MMAPTNPNPLKDNIDQLSINTIRFLAVDAVQEANSGHPGLPLGAAPMAYVLWTRFLRYNPSSPTWFNRDRFVLSAGHGSALLYALLHLTGYDLSLDDLKHFRKIGSKTPGHPENLLTPGVEVTTGPLGQGFGNAVGIAMAEAHLAASYNRDRFPVIDHYTYALVSDGDLMEGVSSEAASLAGHLKLGKLILLYDDNHISLDGPTGFAFTEDVLKRFDAYDWHTQRVEDGNDLQAIENAITNAKQETEKPSIISVRTIIGYGSPQQNTSKVHGSALGIENVKKTKEFFGWDPAKNFFIPEGVKENMQIQPKKGVQAEIEWNTLYKEYGSSFPKEAADIEAGMNLSFPESIKGYLPLFKHADGALATRQASGKTIEALKKKIPWIFGGSADLASSNEMPVNGEISFQPGHYAENNIWFGVREHGMGTILNGMAAHKGLKVYGGTFLTFSDYMKGAIRLAALSHQPVVYVFTHDSIALGEDGPTHQPIEHVAALRAIPNMVTIRPGDANETVEACRIAMERKDGPVALILSRQKIPVIDQDKYPAAAEYVEKGAYILKEADAEIQLILIATGSELFITLEAGELLNKEGISTRVVSMPSWELFEKQEENYKKNIFPPEIKLRLSVEALSPFGWEKYTGTEGKIMGINRFGESGAGEAVLKAFGFTIENIVQESKKLLRIS